MKKDGHFKEYILRFVFAYRRVKDTTLFLSLALWLCLLPLLAIFVVPFVGWQIAGYIAVFLLIGVLIICWFLCNFRIPETPDEIQR